MAGKRAIQRVTASVAHGGAWSLEMRSVPADVSHGWEG